MPDTLAPPANDALPLSSRSELRFLACGSVDDGKSTLIGRLINDATGLPEDEVASLRDDSRRFGTTDDELDFALLLDGLEAEREQGITIDVAYRFFTTPRRAFVVADTPGHQQYTRNMATGASNAELAVLLVDARKGLTEQTRRHAAIVSLLGIRHVVLAVNKIDLVEFSEARFREIEAAFTAFATPLAFHSVVPIPVSARLGDNVAIRGKRTPWYAGPTLLGHLETVETDLEAVGAPLRFPVQWVNRPDGEFRGFTGTVASGRVAVGDKLVVAGSGRASAVARIVSFDGDLPSAAAGRSVTLTLADEVDVIRGDLLADPRRRPVVTRRLAADLVWMDETPATPGKRFLLKIGTATVPATLSRISDTLDVESLRRVEHGLVAIRRRVHEQELVARLHRCATDLGVAGRRAAHVEDRRDPADELLHRDRQQRGLVEQPLMLVGMLDQREERARDDGAGGLGAAVDEQQPLREHLLGGEDPVLLRPHPQRHDVVRGRGLPGLHQAGRVLAVVAERLHHAVVHVPRTAAGDDRRLRPVLYARPLVVVEAEEPRDDEGR